MPELNQTPFTFKVTKNRLHNKKSIAKSIYAENAYYQLRISYYGGDYDTDFAAKKLWMPHLDVNTKPKQKRGLTISWFPNGKTIIEDPLLLMVAPKEVPEIIEMLQIANQTIPALDAFVSEYFPPEYLVSFEYNKEK